MAAQGAAVPAVVTKTPVLPAIALPPVAVTTVTPVTVLPAVATVLPALAKAPAVATAPAVAPAAPLVKSAAGPAVLPNDINGECFALLQHCPRLPSASLTQCSASCTQDSFSAALRVSSPALHCSYNSSVC